MKTASRITFNPWQLHRIIYSVDTLIDSLVKGDHPIKVYRNYRRLTQQELANRIGKSKPYVAKLEAGERTGTIDVLSKIAEALKVDLDQLA